jgi:hypothetical protein
MTGLPVLIESADPSSGEPITVTVDGASSQALAKDRERGFVQPQDAVVVLVFP